MENKRSLAGYSGCSFPHNSDWSLSIHFHYMKNSSYFRFGKTQMWVTTFPGELSLQTNTGLENNIDYLMKIYFLSVWITRSKRAKPPWPPQNFTLVLQCITMSTNRQDRTVLSNSSSKIGATDWKYGPGMFSFLWKMPTASSRPFQGIFWFSPKQTLQKHFKYNNIYNINSFINVFIFKMLKNIYFKLNVNILHTYI